MDPFDRVRLGDGGCVVLFHRLFPLGFAGDDVVAEVAPEGWERSPLLAVFHPSVEQVYRESLSTHRHLERLARPPRDGPPRPEPTLDEVRRGWDEKPVDRDREVADLVGRCLWDIFSDNHEVMARDGRIVDLGPFRGSGGFIADLLNAQTPSGRYDYLDFYMGTMGIGGRAGLAPVYRMIFRRLAAQGCDWTYRFPPLYVVAFDDVDALALAERIGRERQDAELRRTLEDGHRKALEAAKDRPPPETVEAYRQIYGHLPNGWPPWESERLNAELFDAVFISVKPYDTAGAVALAGWRRDTLGPGRPFPRLVRSHLPWPGHRPPSNRARESARMGGTEAPPCGRDPRTSLAPLFLVGR